MLEQNVKKVREPKELGHRETSFVLVFVFFLHVLSIDQPFWFLLDTVPFESCLGRSVKTSPSRDADVMTGHWYRSRRYVLFRLYSYKYKTFNLLLSCYLS